MPNRPTAYRMHADTNPTCPFDPSSTRLSLIFRTKRHAFRSSLQVGPSVARSSSCQYAKLPDDISERYCLLLDPMLGRFGARLRLDLIA